MALPQFVQPIDAGGSRAIKPVGQVLALRARDPWREATDRARETAIQRETVVSYVRALVDSGVTQNNAVGVLLARAAEGRLPAHFAMALGATAKAGRTAPSRSAICDWCAQYREGGVNALLPEHKGRVVEAAGWWGPALERFNSPSKPDMSAVHRYLVEVEHFAVSYDQVRSYLTGVPAMFGRNSPARIGKNLYRLTEKAYVRRSTENALPGDVYVADGYRADVYLAHPVTGGIWRPELTVAIDLRSRVCVGWRADEHEGTYAVQNMWAECFDRWSHVPPFIYVDNGSGYKNQFMSDEVTGFYARSGVQQVIHALPGNPHGKTWIERFFRLVKDDFLKLWHDGAYYCGDDMSAEALQKLVRDVKAGHVALPSLAQFSDAFNDWLDRYAHRQHPEDKTTTRAALWSQLAAIPPHASVTELKRQATVLTVHRAAIKHGRRAYSHADLHAFNGQKLVLEYDLMDDRVAVIRTQDGRWVCDAHLVTNIDAIAPNRLQEKREARKLDAMARLQKKMDEQKARAGLVFDADAAVDATALDAPTRLLDGAAAGAEEIRLFDL